MNKHDAFNAIGYGLGVVQLERVRQVDKHNWTPEHDDQYVNNELLLYTEYWMSLPDQGEWRKLLINQIKNSRTDGWGDEWFKYDERTPEERLARAGALICAEIDRQRRAAKAAPQT